MVTKIGKILTLFFLQGSIVWAADQISLRAIDMQGRAIKQVQVGMPFVLEVTVSGNKIPPNAPKIEGLKKVHVENQNLFNTVTSIINGVVSEKKQYRYVVRADKEGSYRFGPAVVQSNPVIESNSIQITVSTHVEYAPQSQEVFLKLFADNERVMVGQELTLYIRFYAQSGIDILNIQEPVLTHFVPQSPIEGPVAGKETIHGKEIPYLQWQLRLVARKEGEVIVPALAATYQVERKNSRDLGFDMFALFFNASFNQKTVFSNALKLHIDPLPAHDQDVQGTGSFTSFSASLDHETARVGEGVILRLEIEGSGDFDSLRAPSLHLPQAFSYYDSRNYIDKHDAQRKKKIFEYVLQAKEAGNFTLPEQVFTYFDFKEKKYLTKKSNVLALTILDAQPKHKQQELTLQTTSSIISQGPNESVDNKAILHTDAWRFMPIVLLSWPIFYSFFIILMGIIMLSYMLSFIRSWQFVKRQLIKRKAWRALKYAQQYNRCAEIYDIFVTFFSSWFEVSEQTICAEYIEHVLSKKQFSELELQKWQCYLDAIVAYKFLSHDMYHNHQEAFAESYIWIKRLEKVL